MQKKKIMSICLILTVLLTACAGNREENTTFAESKEEHSVAEESVSVVEEENQDTQEIYQTEYITIQKVGEMRGDLQYSYMPSYMYIMETESVPVLDEKGNPTEAYQVVEKNYQVYNEWGEPIDMTDYVNMYQGIIIREKADESCEENEVGFYDTDGTEIFRARCVEYYTLEPERNRYFVIKVRENEVSETDEWFEREDEHYYAGYAVILDLKNKKILDNLVIRSDKERFYGIGDNIIIEEWETDNFKIYDENGMILKEFVESEDVSYTRDSFFIYEYHYATKTTDVYDEKGDYLFSTDKEISKVSFDTYTGDFLVFEEESGQGCVDRKGNIILPPEYDLIACCSSGLYTAIRNMNGEDDLCTFFTKDGMIAKDVENTNYANDIEEYGVCRVGSSYKQDDVIKSSIWTMASNEYKEITGQVVQTVMGLGVWVSQDGYAGLIDFNSGEQLLPQEYENINASCGRIYAKKDNVYSIFEVTDFHWPVNEEDDKK